MDAYAINRRQSVAAAVKSASFVGVYEVLRRGNTNFIQNDATELTRPDGGVMTKINRLGSRGV
jgi:hypothetical protein